MTLLPLAQIVIDNNCPSWLPVWICTLSIRGFAGFLLLGIVLGLIYYDFTHPVGHEEQV